MNGYKYGISDDHKQTRTKAYMQAGIDDDEQAWVNKIFVFVENLFHLSLRTRRMLQPTESERDINN